MKMVTQYTEEVQNQIFDFAEDEIDAIWQDIQNTPQDASVDLWKKSCLKSEENSIYPADSP